MLHKLLKGVLQSLLLFSTSMTIADYFPTPANCQNGVTGWASGGDPLSGQSYPTVTVSYNAGNQLVFVTDVVVQPLSAGGFQYAFTIPVSFQTYFIVFTYSPFLQGYTSVINPNLGVYTNAVPTPGSFVNPQYSLIGTASLLLTTAIGSNIPLPYGFLEMAPEFVGSSPYVLQADQNGVVTINCIVALPTGNAGSVLDANGNHLYDAVFDVRNRTMSKIDGP